MADGDYDRDVNGRNEYGERAVDERLVDDDVDVVEAVLQHRDRGREGQPNDESGEDHAKGKVLHSWASHQDERHDRDGNGRPDVREPLELLTLVAPSASEPDSKADGR